jgi:hypothetical protein
MNYALITVTSKFRKITFCCTLIIATACYLIPASKPYYVITTLGIICAIVSLLSSFKIVGKIETEVAVFDLQIARLREFNQGISLEKLIPLSLKIFLRLPFHPDHCLFCKFSKDKKNEQGVAQKFANDYAAEFLRSNLNKKMATMTKVKIREDLLDNLKTLFPEVAISNAVSFGLWILNEAFVAENTKCDFFVTNKKYNTEDWGKDGDRNVYCLVEKKWLKMK